jgi:hypothetical protein
MKTFNEIYQNWMDGNITAAKQAVEELNKTNPVTPKQQFSVITSENPSIRRIPARQFVDYRAHAVCH